MIPAGFTAYARKVLAQKKPHHVISGATDLLMWLTDEWEEVEDCLGSSSREVVLRRRSDGQHVRVSTVWLELADPDDPSLRERGN